MEVNFAVAKVSKYASRQSGDTLELIERPHGGISLVLVDGQRSGRSAKAISSVVARKAVQLLAEGVRDGAAARAAHDYLYTYRGGKVSATLNILSVDTRSRTVVISRNNPAPVIVYTSENGLILLDDPSMVVGVIPSVKPNISEYPLSVGTIVVAYTDGLSHAGSVAGDKKYYPEAVVLDLVQDSITNPALIADTLLQGAVDLDDGRPRDDISVVVVAVSPRDGDETRRLSGRLPL